MSNILHSLLLQKAAKYQRNWQFERSNIESYEQLKDAKELMTPLSFSHTWKMYQTVIWMKKWLNPLPCADVIVAVFRVVTQDGSSIFAHTYNTIVSTESLTTSDEISPGIRFCRVMQSIGGTYSSRDGEYRRRSTPADNLEYVMKFFEDPMSHVERYICGLMDRGNIGISVDIHYPEKYKQYSDQFEEWISTSRIGIYLFTTIWMIDYHKLKFHYIEKNLHDHYYSALTMGAHDMVYKTMIKKFGNFAIDRKSVV